MFATIDFGRVLIGGGLALIGAVMVFGLERHDRAVRAADPKLRDGAR